MNILIMILRINPNILSRKIRTIEPIIPIQIMRLIKLFRVPHFRVPHHKLLKRQPELHRADVARLVPPQRRQELHGLPVRHKVPERLQELLQDLPCEGVRQRPVPQPDELVLPLLRPDGLVVHRLRVEPPRVEHGQLRRLQHVLDRRQLHLFPRRARPLRKDLGEGRQDGTLGRQRLLLLVGRRVVHGKWVEFGGAAGCCCEVGIDAGGG